MLYVLGEHPPEHHGSHPGRDEDDGGQGEAADHVLARSPLSQCVKCAPFKIDPVLVLCRKRFFHHIWVLALLWLSQESYNYLPVHSSEGSLFKFGWYKNNRIHLIVHLVWSFPDLLRFIISSVCFQMRVSILLKELLIFFFLFSFLPCQSHLVSTSFVFLACFEWHFAFAFAS